MAVTASVTLVLSKFFNVGDGKRSSKEFVEELKKMTPAEKQELAIEVTKVTGDTLLI